MVESKRNDQEKRCKYPSCSIEIHWLVPLTQVLPVFFRGLLSSLMSVSEERVCLGPKCICWSLNICVLLCTEQVNWLHRRHLSLWSLFINKIAWHTENEPWINISSLSSCKTNYFCFSFFALSNSKCHILLFAASFFSCSSITSCSSSSNRYLHLD